MCLAARSDYAQLHEITPLPRRAVARELATFRREQRLTREK
jgi:hypothetical protein